ncbi:uncharacterized protein [Ptychodera flava]|uniref:uncharacterized protein n=1 Tax=Ptychodera flava TaxID=63121 RepID=UPI00396A03B3
MNKFKMWLLFDVAAVSIFLFMSTVIAEVGEEATGAAGQCPYTVSVTKYYVKSVLASREVTTYTRCWSWTARCTKKRTETYIVYKSASMLSEETHYRPCPDVTTPCPLNNCTNHCGKCEKENTKSCDHATDLCRCKPGWIGRSCNETCDPGYYGNGCVNQCACNVNTTISCDPVDGTCNCQSGWMQPHCHTERSTEPYIPVTTTPLISLTEEPVTPPLYTTNQTSEPPTPLLVGRGETGMSYGDPGVMAGIIIIILLVVSATIVVTALLVYRYKRRRHNENKEKHGGVPDEVEMTTTRLRSESTEYQDIADNVYSDVLPKENSYTDISMQRSASQASLGQDLDDKAQKPRGNVYVDMESNDEDSVAAMHDTPSADKQDIYQVPPSALRSTEPVEYTGMDSGSGNGVYQNLSSSLRDVPSDDTVYQTPRSPYLDTSGDTHLYQTPKSPQQESSDAGHIYKTPRSPLLDASSDDHTYQTPRSPFLDTSGNDTYQIPPSRVSDASVSNSVYQTPRSPVLDSGSSNHLYQTPRTPSKQEPYMDMTVGDHTYQTPRSPEEVDTTETDEQYSPMKSQHKKPQSYASLYTTPRPIPAYSDVDQLDAKHNGDNDDKSNPSTADEDELYSKVDRTGRSYRGKDRSPEKHYASLDNLANGSSDDSMYDQVAHLASNGYRDNSNHDDREAMDDDGESGQTYDRLNRTGIPSKRTGAKRKIRYAHVADNDKE